MAEFGGRVSKSKVWKVGSSGPVAFLSVRPLAAIFGTSEYCGLGSVECVLGSCPAGLFICVEKLKISVGGSVVCSDTTERLTSFQFSVGRGWFAGCQNSTVPYVIHVLLVRFLFQI